MSTALLYDPKFLEHKTPDNHPESSDRLIALMKHLKALEWYGDLALLDARDATEEDLLRVHTIEYVQRVAKACEANEAFVDTPEVGICPESYAVALRAVGASLALADAVMSKKSKNGFAALRPPGHHAEKDKAMGFCLFNNIAITAEYIKKKYGLERILIFDWDVHHGNGTQHIFESDPSVFYVSMHQSSLYPGTGLLTETGMGAGKGMTLNCPVPSGAGDLQYKMFYRNDMQAKLEAYKPQCILISAGFDAHAMDPLATMNLTVDSFGWLTQQICELAQQSCDGKVISLLEGGYDLTALPLCVAKHLEVLKSFS
ncbi:MAG: acetoin utilization deacetylase AcuC-like enzyme [Candidatus Omnitrophota bacterium]|jgi:acetoin utilization deacetylase AcuC-like enzyme